jgi:hypothetical protein
MELSHYTIDQLVELKNEIENRIYSYEDGYIYICRCRSYGRNWNENGIKNTYTLQELCDRYSGDDGIVDVYSTNPNLIEIKGEEYTGISNYGDVKYIKSVDDYEKWRTYERLVRDIPELEKEWEEWENRDSVPFNYRSKFAPIYPKEYINEWKKQLEEFDMSFTPPSNYYKEDTV